MSALHRFATLLLMAMHFVLAGALLGIGIPLVARIEAQLAGGYVPTGYAAVVDIAAIALGLAVATGVGLIAWARVTAMARHQRRRFDAGGVERSAHHRDGE
jgi:hypothetical protein